MYRKYIKRLLDFVLSLIFIILLSPLMLIIALITLIDLGLPIHNEVREREGMNKKTFIMYKFRTKRLRSQMKPNLPKYTKISSVIERLRLNELPQLFNVLKGEMALVGPRPFIPGDKLPKGQISPKRYMVRPGMTGPAQASGGRGLTHKDKLAYDIIYYDNMSFMYDFKIIVKTILNIFRIDR